MVTNLAKWIMINIAATTTLSSGKSIQIGFAALVDLLMGDLQADTKLAHTTPIHVGYAGS